MTPSEKYAYIAGINHARNVVLGFLPKDRSEAKFMDRVMKQLDELVLNCARSFTYTVDEVQR